MELPPGFRFHPTDEEVIVNYLTEKVLDRSFSPRAIGEVDLNKCEPWDLPSKAVMGEKEWYFYCQKDKKYPTGTRTNRATESGYWKATGKDKGIYKGEGTNQLIGMKKTLVFYEGRAPKGRKTNWVMHEFRLDGNSSQHLPKAEREEWVVCRVIFKSTEALIKKSAASMSPSMEQPLHPDDLFDASTLPPLTDSPHPKPYGSCSRSLPAKDTNNGGCGDLLGFASTLPMGMNHQKRDPNSGAFAATGINEPLHPYKTNTFSPNFHYCRPQYCPNPSPSVLSTPSPVNKFYLHHNGSTSLADGSSAQQDAAPPLGRPQQCKEEQHSIQSPVTVYPIIPTDWNGNVVSKELVTARSFDDIEHLLPSVGSLTDMESYLKF